MAVGPYAKELSPEEIARAASTLGELEVSEVNRLGCIAVFEVVGVSQAIPMPKYIDEHVQALKKEVYQGVRDGGTDLSDPLLEESVTFLRILMNNNPAANSLPLEGLPVGMSQLSLWDIIDLAAVAQQDTMLDPKVQQTVSANELHNRSRVQAQGYQTMTFEQHNDLLKEQLRIGIYQTIRDRGASDLSDDMLEQVVSFLKQPSTIVT